MRHNIYKVFTVALAFVLPSVAVADMDYRCLKDCKRDGKAYGECAQECTYMPKSSFRNYNPVAHDSHNPFTAPQPVSDNTVLPQKTVASPAKETEDYACATKCQQSGFQFELCEKRCTKPAALSAFTDRMNTPPGTEQKAPSFSPPH